MKLEQIYTGCLAHAAYYIESRGEAALFDPLREAGPYLERAARDNARIKYVFETHFHADFVSGHLELQQQCGAGIVFGPLAKPAYAAIVAEDGQEFQVGDYRIQVIHTPGHTLESTTYLLWDEHGEAHGIITGDTLFIGDVGRPDLAQHVVADLTEDKLARMLYHSLREKIMPLPDHLMVYPNHGKGSACGKMMSSETTDTLGHQKQVNYALQPMTEDEFVKAILTGLTPPPGYFPENVLLNIGGYESLSQVLERGLKPLSPEQFEAATAETGSWILDTRSAADYAISFVPGSINFGLNGNFAQIVGELIPDIQQEILLVTEEGKAYESMIRLSRVGFDHCIGYLEGGVNAWKNSGRATGHIHRISARQLEEKMEETPMPVFDVRRKSEYDSQHLEGAVNVPLHLIRQQLAAFPKDREFALHCAGGYRSMTAASLLKQQGWDHFVEINGGFKALALTGLPKTEYVCPTTLL